MKILILGGQGNLGTQLTKTFSVDFEVISWDRSELDVLDFTLLAEKIREIKPSLIINTVAYNAVDKCEDKKEYKLALKLNTELPAILADVSLHIGAVLIHYSTDYVFNGTEDKQEFFETDTPNPINKYGESKFAGECEILKQAERGLDYYLIRTSKLFGPRGLSESAKPSFFDIMLGLVQDNKEITVVNEELSCFTYTPDLAEATKRLWEVEAPFGIYHIVNEGACNWYEGAKILFSLKKMEVNIRAVRSENLLRAARRPKFSVLKNLKIKKMRNFSEALREYLNN
ncbi:MAG: NAD(P)-dependent oxidoreductase [Candidatus Falkowbacteria bacterium]